MANGSQKQRRVQKARRKKKARRSGRHKVRGELDELKGRVDRQQLEGADENIVLASDYTVPD